MGIKISKTKINNVINFNFCQVCKTKYATLEYSSCGHLGLCEDCHNIILQNTTCPIQCPICNIHNFKEY